jgi:hypothetical protein
MYQRAKKYHFQNKKWQTQNVNKTLFLKKMGRQQKKSHFGPKNRCSLITLFKIKSPLGAHFDVLVLVAHVNITHRW